MTVAIDWDDVVHARPQRGFGKPTLGARESVEAIVDEGIHVVIHTCVAASSKGRQAVIDWLDKYDVPYSEVTAIKPVADLYIDNKGLHHVSWDKTLKEINSRLGVEIDGVD